MKKLKNKIRPIWVKNLRKNISSRIKLEFLTKKIGLKPISNNPLQSIKSSDTLFILGSGSSINKLTTEQWDNIRKNDSIGFNFWLVHSFIPSIYVFEMPSKKSNDHFCMINNFSIRKKEYRNIPLIMKDGERYKGKVLQNFIQQIPLCMRTNLQLSWDWEIEEEDIQKFTKKLQYLYKKGRLSSTWQPNIRKRASIFYLILLGVRAKYKNIVLCGVDLNNTLYFYDEKREELTQKGRNIPKPRTFSHIHKTDDPAFGQLTISQAINILNTTILKKEGISLFISSEESSLYPLIPLFKPEK